MKKFISLIIIGLTACSLSSAFADYEAPIRIDKKARPISVSITGFSEEAAKVIKFDLAVLGIIEGTPVEFSIIGTPGANVSGRLVDEGLKKECFNRGFSGGSVRLQAHAFAEEVVKNVRPDGYKPIFNTKIAYRTGADLSAMEIAVADFDGFNSVTVTHDHTLVNGPAWALGANKIFYASWKTGSPQIYAQSLATGERRVVGKFYGNVYSPAVSPDGQRLAFISSMNGNPDLYVSSLDGSGVKQLTHSRDPKSSPCWSPDGTQICFVDKSGRAALYKISANGGAAQRISTTSGGNITEPDWSPDGKKIVFTALTGSFNLYVVPAEGGNAELLVAGEDPCWAPNSRTVIFSRRENNKRVLSLLDVPTKRVKDVRQISGSCSQPSWAR